MSPRASIVIPTRRRPEYLGVTLDSVAPQARAQGVELLIADDGHDASTAELAERHGARLVTVTGTGANAARNAGVAASGGDPIVFLDDDVVVPPHWLDAVLAGVAAYPGHEAFGGPIHARLEGGGPRACGREPAPITTLDLGPEDRDVDLVWSANMAIRRRALERVGPFDESIRGRGEEEDWQRRLAAQGGAIRYLAGAGLEHRRTRADARLSALASSAFALGRTARRYDLRKGEAPRLGTELLVLAGCLGHVARRRCLTGLVMAAHAAGRVREAMARASA
jgi:glycosyltransferase involved in cell wall biosynthesis